MRPLRSLLFAPGSEPRKLEKVVGFGADAVIADLEDAVADSEKEAARVLVRSVLERQTTDAYLVRVNGPDGDLWVDDLEAVVCPGLAGVMVPKVEHPEQLPEVSSRLELLESAAGMEPGDTPLIGLVETPLGITRLDDIAQMAPPRTRTLALGTADLSAELGVELTIEGTELLHARSRMVMAVRAAGLEAPLDGPFLAIRDLDGLRRSSEASRALGFQGRIAIHPGQVEPVNEVFGYVDAASIAAAHRIVEAFEEAESRGAASIQVDGTFVDYPIYWNAKAQLDRPAHE